MYGSVSCLFAFDPAIQSNSSTWIHRRTLERTLLNLKRNEQRRNTKMRQIMRELCRSQLNMRCVPKESSIIGSGRLAGRSVDIKRKEANIENYKWRTIGVDLCDRIDQTRIHLVACSICHLPSYCICKLAEQTKTQTNQFIFRIFRSWISIWMNE